MAKRAKSSNGYAELPDDDRISNLPDGIRCHILSFLHTKDAVATTALSTNWKDLWTMALNDISFINESVPFDFPTDEECKSNNMKFARFANKVLLFHKLPVIKRFTLDCTQDPFYDVYSWVSMAILKKIEYLKLLIRNEDDAPIQLPTSLFTCETLEVLKLEGLSIIVKMLTPCSLPRLKKLELLYILYENDESARKLISSCPSLESLSISREMWDGVENFIVKSSTLKDLRIDQSNLERSDLTKYVINAPVLQHLELIEGSVNGFFIETSSPLVKTDIKLSYFEDILSNVDSSSNLLQGIRNSKILNISRGIFQLAIPAIPAHLVPKFDRLSELKVIMNCCEWHSLQEFIKKSDRLEALEFTKYNCAKRRHLVCWRNPKTVPICLLSSLKTMTYFGFDGLKDELRMVEYILKNANVLQKMEIHFHYSLRNTETEPQLREKLLKFSKGSEECEVIIS